MKKIIYNDYELLYLIKRGSYDAYCMLLDKYTPLIYKSVNNIQLEYNVKDDLIQDCKVEIVTAVWTFNTKLNVMFYTYINLIIQRKISRFMLGLYKDSVIIKEMQNKITGESIIMESAVNYEPDLTKLIHNEQYTKLCESIKIFDRLVLNEIMIKKMNKNEFVQKYNSDIKKVYNSMYKIREQFSKLINKNIK